MKKYILYFRGEAGGYPMGVYSSIEAFEEKGKGRWYGRYMLYESEEDTGMETLKWVGYYYFDARGFTKIKMPEK